jgi:phosphoribosylanthranilate isomerase
MVRVKICGVTNDEDLRAVERAGADAIGLITDVPVDTPREVSLEVAADLAAMAPPFLTTTVVTMPETVDAASETVDAVQPDVLQVHGEFGPEALRSLREAVPAKVIAVVDAEASERVRTVAPAVDAVLMDSVDDAGAGGTGETHDWKATAEVATTVDAPVVLAGGLTPENVAEAVETVQPFAVDVASGVERSGGRKDHDAVDAFVANAVAAGADSDGRPEAPEEVPS